MINETPLPWVQKLSSNRKHYTISSKNKNVVKDVGTLGDALYIEEACNNYPKVIELLKEALDQLDSMIEEETFTKRRISEFLNSIK